jgi:hypothetical protein
MTLGQTSNVVEPFDALHPSWALGLDLEHLVALIPPQHDGGRMPLGPAGVHTWFAIVGAPGTPGVRVRRQRAMAASRHPVLVDRLHRG